MYIGIDIGGTSCRVAATPSLKEVSDFVKKEFILSHIFENDFSTILDLTKELSQGEVAAIGMGVPGELNEGGTEFTDPSVNLTEWNNKPVKPLLHQTFPCPIFLKNDAAAAGLGEAVYGNVRHEDFTFVIWGTGIGGALVAEKNGVYTSKKLDWYTYFDEWEKDCGGNKIREKYPVDAAHLSEEKWQQVMKDFSYHLSAFLERTDTKTIVFGGGVALKQSERLLTLRKHFPSVEISVSSLGEDCGLYGAFALIKSYSQR